MRELSDLWYIRFPDGRVLRAAGIAVIRQQLAAGRIPAGAHLRRSLDEDWRALERFPELADLAGNHAAGHPSTSRDRPTPTPATIASRLDPLVLQQVGIRGLLDELLAALDSTAVRVKLSAAAWTGAVGGALAGLAWLPFFSFEIDPPGPGWLLVLGELLLLAWLTGVLSRLTFSELSRLRPARWGDALRGSASLTLRLVLLLLLGAVVVAGLALAARWLPGYLLESAGSDAASGWAILVHVVAVAALVVEALAWALLLLLLPLGPLLVVEDCSAWAGLARWLALVRDNLRRLLLAECLAAGIACLIGLPAALLLAAVWTARPAEPLLATVHVARSALTGLAAGWALAYLVVANVFLYLHFRYDRR
jgi:hypothetical protein